MCKIWKFNKNAKGESAPECKAKELRVKLDSGVELTHEEKTWITKQVNNNAYFRQAIPVLGWAFDFSDVLHKFYVDNLNAVVYAMDEESVIGLYDFDELMVYKMV